MTYVLGLSPRVRGNPLTVYSKVVAVGSIPACAGEPPGRQTSDVLDTVYPRVCGGTVVSSASASAKSGLSPRVRGNPSVCISDMAPSRVYPRVCGGTSPLGSASTPTTGLSPRVRGNRVTMGQAEQRGRSIPACAGEPR